MKAKLMFIAGAGVGYVLGIRAGRGNYEKLKTSARKLWARDEVQETVATVQNAVKAQAGEAVHKLAEQVLPSKGAATDSPAEKTPAHAATTADRSAAVPLDVTAQASDEFPDAGLHSGGGRN